MPVIIFDSVIGAGKSTYANRLHEELGTPIFLESVETNPILERYYSDKEKYGFLLQIYFLNERFAQIKQGYRTRNAIIDRAIFTDQLFTYVNYINENFSKEEYDTYCNLLDNMMEELEFFPEYKKNPDLLVYLDITFENEMKNISKRGRGFEQVVDDEGNIVDQAQYNYFKQLYEAYEYWIGRKVDPTGNIKPYDKSPVLFIDANKYDVHNDEDWEEVYGLISAKMKELDLLD